YFLNDIKVLSVDSRRTMVRITSCLSHDNFLRVMAAKHIFLEIIMDGVKHECIPSRGFLTLQREFQNNYFTIEHILQ
ncbi:MAG: hypothetical protein LBB80_06420, partial [Treponema sp.]|nr:hypothetical protein [Treponema sp.]